MYDKIQIRTYTGPAGQQEVVKAILRANRVPTHSASVYEQNHDTGYPGLAVTSTFVDLSTGNTGLAKKVDNLLRELNFQRRN
jgi:hypothetical protein